MTVRSRFSDQDLEAIRAATRSAEEKTGGELVCVIVNRCDSYQAPLWQAAALAALGGATVAALGLLITDRWMLTPLSWILLPPFVGAGLGILFAWCSPTLRRWLVPAAVLARRVDRRAAAAFLDEEVFDTRDRTGVLLFVALFEHQIRILADRGVEQKVPIEAWQPIIGRLGLGLRSSRPGAAIVDAIEACGDLLTEHGVERTADDRDELDNRPRLLDE